MGLNFAFKGLKVKELSRIHSSMGSCIGLGTLIASPCSVGVELAFTVRLALCADRGSKSEIVLLSPFPLLLSFHSLFSGSV